MFYDETNLHPENEGVNNNPNPETAEPVSTEAAGHTPDDSATRSAPSGEYHYTRETNPGAAPTEQPRASEPQNSGWSAPNSHYDAQSGNNAQNSSYGARSGNDAQNTGYGAQSGNNAQNSGYSAQNGNSAQNTGYGAQSGNNAQNTGYGAQNGWNAQNTGYSAQNGNNAQNSSYKSGYNAQNTGYGARSGYNASNTGYNAQNTGNSAQNTDSRAQRSTRRTVPPRPTASPVPPTPPKKRKRSGSGAGKFVALALVCSLMGGAVGAGSVYALRGAHLGGGTANVSISDHSEGGVTVNTSTVTAGESMTPAQIYKTYGDAVVCINISTSQGTGAGTGFIIDGKEGYVLTCYHVIDGAKSISVTLNDSTSYSATYVGGDKDQDCAIIKITPKDGETLNLKSVVLGDSTKLEVGESVCTIGNALGTLANTLTSGTVSALNRSESMEDGTVMNVLQTDTSINSGNSGGPLFNSYGEVIGIVNAKRSSNAFSNTASIEGIAFAIPISDVTDMMSDLMEHGYVTGKPLLGVTLATITKATAQQYTGMVPGAYVRAVTDGSAAAKAGMQVGDIITSFDGKEVTSSAEVIELKRQHKAGDEVDVVVHRNGDDVQLKVTLDEDPDHDNPIDDGSNQSSSGEGDQGYGYGYSFGGDDNGGSYGYGGFPFSFFGW